MLSDLIVGDSQTGDGAISVISEFQLRGPRGSVDFGGEPAGISAGSPAGSLNNVYQKYIRFPLYQFCRYKLIQGEFNVFLTKMCTKFIQGKLMYFRNLTKIH